MLIVRSSLGRPGNLRAVSKVYWTFRVITPIDDLRNSLVPNWEESRSEQCSVFATELEASLLDEHNEEILMKVLGYSAARMGELDRGQGRLAQRLLLGRGGAPPAAPVVIVETVARPADLLFQIEERKGEVTNSAHGVGEGRKDSIDTFPVSRCCEVIGARTDDSRANAVERRAVALTSSIGSKRFVAGATCGIIVEQFSGDVQCDNLWRRSVHGEVRIDLAICPAGVTIAVHDNLSDVHGGERNDERASRGAGFLKESSWIQANRE